MPALEGPSLEALQRKPVTQCGTCRRWVRPNYCRQCDVFFNAGHVPICPDAVHDAHRTY